MVEALLRSPERMEGSFAGGYLPAAALTQSSVHKVYEVEEGGGFWLTMGTQIEGGSRARRICCGSE